MFVTRALPRCTRVFFTSHVNSSTGTGLWTRGRRFAQRCPLTATAAGRFEAREMATFERLIRFQSVDGRSVKYGDLGEETPTREIEGKEVEVLGGDLKSGFRKTGERAVVGKLLCPLETTNIILCVGLNYRRHAEECNVSFGMSRTTSTSTSKHTNRLVI